MLTLLTTTGTRDYAWMLCQKYMHRQTYSGRVRWIIVDDGENAQQITFKRPGWDLIVLRPEPFWQHGQNTQQRNLLAGLRYVPNDAWLLIIEDDDWYASDWLAVCEKHLRDFYMFGERNARYYNVEKQVLRRLNNKNHASLCATAMRGPVLDLFRTMCASDRDFGFIDGKIWKRVAPQQKHLVGGTRVVGMKGLPGRDNIGIGKELRGVRDSDAKQLRAAIGEDYRHYTSLIKK